MVSADILDRAREVASADVRYGPRFSGVPFLTEEGAVGMLRAGDLIIEYVPQVTDDKWNFHEYALRGCMHIGIVVEFGEGNLYKLEASAKGIYCDRCLFGDYLQDADVLKRFRMAIRSRKMAEEEPLRRAVNASALALGGFEDRDDAPLRVRDVGGNMFMRTHALGAGKPLPKKLYCSELSYLAYKANGMDICPLCSIMDVVEASGGIPERRIARHIAKLYARGTKIVEYAYVALLESERFLGRHKLSFLMPSSYCFRRIAWPHLVFENGEFEVVAIVPPAERYIRDYERLMEASTSPVA